LIGSRLLWEAEDTAAHTATVHAAESERETPEYHDQVTIHHISPLIGDEISIGKAQGSIAAEL